MRTFLLVFHRWVALVIAAVLILVAVSGAVIAFQGAIDRARHPDFWNVTPGERVLSLDTLVAHARAAVPNAKVTGIGVAPVRDRAYVVTAGTTQIFVDPYTGRVQGSRPLAQWNEQWERKMQRFHETLMAGRMGGEIVAAVTATALLLVLTGLILWWPDKIWRVRWSASWKRVNFDLHHLLGITAAVVLAIICASGAVMHYQPLRRLVTVTSPMAAKQLPSDMGSPELSFDSLVAVARHALPGALVVSVQRGADRPVLTPATVGMRFPEEHSPGGRSRVLVDRYRGTPLSVISTRGAPLRARLGYELRSIHTGDIFGKPTEAIWILAALVLASQGITGALMWWNSRAARLALARAGSRGLEK